MPLYRLPLFERLAAEPELRVTVACHTDHTADLRAASSPLRILQTRLLNIGPFRWHRSLLAAARRCDVAVIMFDVRWLSCMLVAFLYPEKAVLWGHGLGRSPVAQRMRLFLARRSAAVLVYEESARAAFIDAGCDPERVFVAGNTVEVARPGRAQGIRSRFLYVGRLQTRKRIEQLLLTFARVQPDLPDSIGVTIVGDGFIRPELERVAEELGIASRVEFTGAVYDEGELAGHYARAIAYVSPGDVGLGVLQSFGYGVPVITCASRTHGPEFENIVDGVNGYICNDMSELGHALAKLGKDSALAETLGMNALHHYCSKRTINDMVGRVAEAIGFVALRSAFRLPAGSK